MTLCIILLLIVTPWPQYRLMSGHLLRLNVPTQTSDNMYHLPPTRWPDGAKAGLLPYTSWRRIQIDGVKSIPLSCSTQEILTTLRVIVAILAQTLIMTSTLCLRIGYNLIHIINCLSLPANGVRRMDFMVYGRTTSLISGNKARHSGNRRSFVITMGWDIPMCSTILQVM